MAIPRLSRKPPVSTHYGSLPISLASQSKAVQLGDRSDWPGIDALPIQGWRTLDNLQPRVLIGSPSNLLWLGAKLAAGSLKLGSLDRALVVSIRLGTPSLTTETREALWRSYRLPIFEIFQADSGDVLAYECEAHEGWHVASGAVFESASEYLHVQQGRDSWDCGFNAEVRERKCGCGISGTMVMPFVVAEQQQRFFAAAS